MIQGEVCKLHRLPRFVFGIMLPPKIHFCFIKLDTGVYFGNTQDRSSQKLGKKISHIVAA
jgi:hypothetical protein